MTRTRPSVLAALAATVLAVGGCGASHTGTPSTTPSPPPAPTATPLPSPTPVPAIVVEQPASGATVTTPVAVSGTADVFEAQFVIDLLDASGRVIAHQPVTATSGTGTRGTYATSIATTYRGAATLDVYDLSGRDTRIDEVLVPIVIAG